MKTLSIIILLFFGLNFNLSSQEIPYGSNEKHGKYVNTGDAKIYYEVYGNGSPIVLLHGGFGYIDDFKKYIPILSKQYKVIAIGTRGYGKSEIGNKKFTYELLADDVASIIKKEGSEKAVLLGHSDGAMISYLVALKYPEITRKVVAMGGPLGTIGYAEEGLKWLKNYNILELFQYRPDFKQIMPQPERCDELGEKLGEMWKTQQIMELEELNKIATPTLLLFGDKDLFCASEHIVKIYRSLSNAQLAVFPNSSHIDISFRNIFILEWYIIPFIEQ